MRGAASEMYRQTVPPTPTRPTTPLATVTPAPKLTLDASGRGLPQGYTVTYPAPSASVTVTFNTTDGASRATPPRPATESSVTEPAERTPRFTNLPSTVAPSARESSRRDGTSEAKPD